MKIDERILKLAENVLKNSVKLKKGERIYIESFGQSTLPTLQAFAAQAAKLGGVPFYYFNDEALTKAWVANASEAQIKAHAEIHKKLMKESDVYVAIRGYDDLFCLSDLPAKQAKWYNQYYMGGVHTQTRVPNTRWCVMRFPNNTMAAMAKMSEDAFEDFYFKSCLLDYSQMDKAMRPLQKLMMKTDKVHIKAKGTDLNFSIKNIPVIRCSGVVNIPDGEVYTAPVKNSINGYIQFNTDTAYNGIFFSNIYLEFENGRIVKARSLVNDDKLQKLLKSDDGACYMGEFALGVNPYITKPMLDILFDEKIRGSFHMAIGNSYDDAFNGNKSSIHWDLVQIQTPECGGGEIYFDDKLIRKDGRFVLKELDALNPENLKK